MNAKFYLMGLMFAICCYTKAQTTAVQDCSLLTKTENYSGYIITSSKEGVVISDDGKTGLKVLIMRATTGVIAISFQTIDKDVICVQKGNTGEVEFTDGSKISIENVKDLNCEGVFAYFLGEQIQKGKELEYFMTKPIKSVNLQYSDTENHKLVKYFRKTNFSNEQGEKVMQIIQCLSQ